MRKGWLLATFGISLFVVGCGGSSGGGTGGSGGHAGTIGGGGHTGGSGGHAGSGGTAGAAGGHAGGGAAGGTAGGGGGHAGSGGTAGAAGGHAGGGGGATGGTAGAAGGHAGNAGGAGGTQSDAGTDALAMCGTDTDTSEGVECINVTVDATGPCVSATISNNPPPTPAGGNISQGTYDLTSITVYSGDAAVPNVLSPVRKTVMLTNDTANTLKMQETDVSGSFIRRQEGIVTTTATGTTLTLTQSCPTIDAGSNMFTSGYTYTVGATTTLTIFEDHGANGIVAEVWQKR